MTTDLPPRLDELGAALEQAAHDDLARRDRQAAARVSTRPAWRRRPLVLVLVALLIAIPAAAVAATQIFSDSNVAASIPAGTLALGGTNPTCTTVTAGVEYHCTLANPPSEQGGPAPDQWLGTVEPTVDSTKHVNGGCRSLNAAGTTWECYIGQKAVAEQIIGQSFLGVYAPTPGVG